MKLEELLKNIPANEVIGNTAKDIAEINIDSRLIDRDIFLSPSGEHRPTATPTSRKQ